MLDLDANPGLRWLYRIARLRVSLGFLAALVVFWLATPTWVSLALGAAVGVVGEVVRVWAAGHLRKGREVTSSGPYRLTKHPLYLGSVIVGLGVAIAAANLVVAVVVLAYLTLTLWVAVRLEEATLRDAFGPTYDAYATGRLETSRRSFAVDRVVQNGEHRAILGFVGALGLLGLKVWFGSVV